MPPPRRGIEGIDTRRPGDRKCFPPGWAANWPLSFQFKRQPGCCASAGGLGIAVELDAGCIPGAPMNCFNGIEAYGQWSASERGNEKRNLRCKPDCNKGQPDYCEQRAGLGLLKRLLKACVSGQEKPVYCNRNGAAAGAEKGVLLVKRLCRATAGWRCAGAAGSCRAPETRRCRFRSGPPRGQTRADVVVGFVSSPRLTRRLLTAYST